MQKTKSIGFRKETKNGNKVPNLAAIRFVNFCLDEIWQDL